MIRKGEEVPKKIKYRKCIFEYEEEYKDYFTKNGIIPTTFDTNGIFRNIFLDYNNCLNDEVEIIEEDKKIEKIPYQFNLNYIDSKLDSYTKEEINNTINHIYDKINEIIDKLNEMEKE